MYLDTTTKTLELVLGSAVTTTAMPVMVDYVDMTTTTTLAGSSDSQSNGTTAVTILSAPAASTQRKVNGITVYNADTVAATVTIRLNNNATLRPLVITTLQVGDTLGYTDVRGWYVQDTNGDLKIISAYSPNSIATAIHGSTAKTTPVGADEIGIWDSVTGFLNRVSFTNALNWFAAKAGNIAQAFSTAALTTAGLFDISSVSAGQIKFPATQNPSADVHTLDDYVEGTFTPTIISSGGGIPTYASQVGTYTKIGNRVFYQLTCILATTGTLAAGTVSIAGLPFTTNATAGYVAGGIFANVLAATAVTWINYLIYPATSNILIYKYSAGVGSNMTVADLANTSQFMVSGSYSI